VGGRLLRRPPTTPSLSPPRGATWELRCGTNNRFRVFYEVDTTEQTVWILAIGEKRGNRLFIGGGEIQI